MAVYLNEMQAGCDPALIGFPHILLCMGVVLETNANMYGFHFDSTNQTPGSAAVFHAFIVGQGGNAANAVRLYGACNWARRYNGGGRTAWTTEMQTIAAALGYTGKVSGFDTSIINPQDGTYVEYVPQYGQDRCRIFYKRNEKVDYVTQNVMNLPGGNMSAFRLDRDTNTIVAKPGYKTYTSGAGIQVTNSNEGRLHEVNYALRLVSFTIP